MSKSSRNFKKLWWNPDKQTPLNKALSKGQKKEQRERTQARVEKSSKAKQVT
jgi:hypothetical protein